MHLPNSLDDVEECSQGSSFQLTTEYIVQSVRSQIDRRSMIESKQYMKIDGVSTYSEQNFFTG